MKVAFQNTIFWCWIWALIQANLFYYLELIEFKAYSTPTCISIPLSNLGWFFQKISMTYNHGQNCFSVKKLLSPLKKLLSPQVNVVGKVIGFWQQNLARFNIDIGGVRGRIWNLKNSVISWIYWIFKFCLNKFCPGLL